MYKLGQLRGYFKWLRCFCVQYQMQYGRLKCAHQDIIGYNRNVIPINIRLCTTWDIRDSTLKLIKDPGFVRNRTATRVVWAAKALQCALTDAMQPLKLRKSRYYWVSTGISQLYGGPGYAVLLRCNNNAYNISIMTLLMLTYGPARYKWGMLFHY